MSGSLPTPAPVVTEEGLIRKKRRKFKKREVEDEPKEPQWEREESSEPAAPREKNWVMILLVIGVGFVLFGSASLVALQRLLNPKPPESVADTTDPPPIVAPPTALKDADRAADLDPIPLMRKIENVLHRFFEAKEVEDLRGLVRGGKSEFDRIRDYYRDHRFEMPPVHSVAGMGKFERSGENLYSVDVTYADFAVRPIALEQVGDDFLVDWESWVGWSEMDWAEFMAKRPTEPKVFRVICDKVDYYNYEFSDEERWKSFVLRSPDRERSLYGYVERDSRLQRTLAGLDPERGELTFVVALRYPEDASQPNQVLVDEVLAAGWVLPVSPESPPIP